MKSVQRKFGTFLKRGDNEQDVQTVLAEFKAVDEMLDRLIKDLKAWRDAWEDTLRLQYDSSEAFANLYQAIEPASDPEISRHQPAQTPAKYMQKCLGLQKEYSDEKTDLAQEITLISNKCLRPAEEAKQHTKLLQKTLKHRENMKLDYERYLSRAEHARKKENRTAKEEMALETHEANLAQSQISYNTADDHVRQTIPPVSAAILSLLPHILVNQVMLQTTLVGQLYTVMDAYTRKFGFPNPAPADTEIVSAWESEFTSLRRELEEGISIVASGKSVHKAMNVPEKDKSTVTGLGLRNKVRTRNDNPKALTGLPNRSASGSTQDTAAITWPGADEPAPPKPPRPGSMSSPNPASATMPSPNINLASKPKLSPSPSYGSLGGQKPPPPYGHVPTANIPYPNDHGAALARTPSPSVYQTPTNGLSPMPSLGQEYFAQRKTSQSSIASSAASIAAAKKKPPPPVPAKRIPSLPQAQYVTALFDFEGQSSGDLAFREGDRIKVVKKTESTDDWWDGELRGRVGAFPANYVQM